MNTGILMIDLPEREAFEERSDAALMCRASPRSGKRQFLFKELCARADARNIFASM